MNPIIITHFYNEEFLLPLWLTHHKKYFEYGVLVSYGSTDRSVEIIKDICPHWSVFSSRNGHFDHLECDEEIMDIEKQIPQGWYRIALTCTEFIVGDFHKVLSDAHRKNYDQRAQILIPVNVMTGYDINGSLSNKIPLWEQIKTGVPWEQVNACRSMHNYSDMRYTGGRHFDLNSPNLQPEVQILKFSNVLIGKEMIDRRLQINSRVSERDRQWGIATHNTLTPETIEEYYRTKIETQNPIDLSSRIDKLTKHDSDYVTCLFSNKPEKYASVQKSIKPEKIKYFDGSNINNFSKIINKCVESLETETVILCSDKVLPTYKDINKITTLLDLGYAFVALWKFGLFGFKKELFRKIGVFDERFLSGGYEDFDYLLRLKEANLAIYLSTESKYTQGQSSFDNSKAWDHWCQKWKIDVENNTVRREMEESSHAYNFGPPVPTNFLSYDRSYIGSSILCDNVRVLLEKNFIK